MTETKRTKHFGLSPAGTGVPEEAVREGEPAGSSTDAPTAKPLMSIRLPIVPILTNPVLPPQDSVLGVSCPLPHGIHNKFVNISRFKELLADYPDQRLVSSIVNGFKFGFDLGFRGELTETFPKNNKSAMLHKEGLTESIRKVRVTM